MERNVPQLDALVAELKKMIQPGRGDGPEALGEIVTCSGEKTLDGTKVGINNVRWAVLAATGFGEAKRRISSSMMSDEGTTSSGAHPDYAGSSTEPRLQVRSSNDNETLERP